ncbi:MAG: Holliday junction branch migration protein RuvA [Patescibacteria group bacterium]|jgi:Holliday junction DNA helicase RuvA
MIAYIKGKIKFKGSYLIVETHGVGYKVAVVLDILNNKKVGDEVEFFVHQHLRDDADDLYGFVTMEELNFFEDLISVSGVGPKSAMNIIARFKIDEIKKSIVNEDATLLTKVSGIGKKTAARLILELKNKLDFVDVPGKKASSHSKTEDEAIDALISLGYSRSQAWQALQKIDKNLSLEDKVRQALKHV